MRDGRVSIRRGDTGARVKGFGPPDLNPLPFAPCPSPPHRQPYPGDHGIRCEPLESEADRAVA